MGQDEILFVDSIDRRSKTYTSIDCLGAMILVFDIEADPADLRILLGSRSNVPMHGSIHSTAAPLWCDIDALYPPKDPVSPITPFIGDHQLADGGPGPLDRRFRHHVKAILTICHDCPDAFSEPIKVQYALFGFPCHGGIEPDDGLYVLQSCWSNEEAFRIHGLGRMGEAVVSQPARGL